MSEAGSPAHTGGSGGPSPRVDQGFRDALEHGTPAPLALYRRAYATVGLPWPGDLKVRRRHPVVDDQQTTGSDAVPAAGGGHPQPSVVGLRWSRRRAIAGELVRRRVRVEVEAFERGWDAALDLAREVVRDAGDVREALDRLRGLAETGIVTAEPTPE